MHPVVGVQPDNHKCAYGPACGITCCIIEDAVRCDRGWCWSGGECYCLPAHQTWSKESPTAGTGAQLYPERTKRCGGSGLVSRLVLNIISQN